MKQIQHHPNYSVTKDGKVFSHNTNSYLMPFNNSGYLRVGLSTENKCKKFLVHRLVALTYINNPENKAQINHINGIKTDNRIVNLEWVSNSENNIHAFKLGLKESNIKASKLNVIKATEVTKKPVIDLLTGVFYESARDAAKYSSHSISMIYSMLSGACKNKTSLTYA